jgi:hypothetical protein
MNKGLGKLWQLGKSAAGDLVDQTGVTMHQVLDDLKELQVNSKGKIDELLKEWAEDETVYELFEGFLKASEKGWDVTVNYLRAHNKNLQTYLKKQVRLTPHLVGGVDGFLQVYLATPTERWVRSPRYRKGVKIGRIIGVICAFTIFLPVSIGRAMISILPGASRAAKYFAKQWKAAQEKRTEDRARG